MSGHEMDHHRKIFYENIDVNNITFTNPTSRISPKVKIGYLHENEEKELIIAPKAVYFYTFGLQKDMFDTYDNKNKLAQPYYKPYNMCFCINMNDNETKDEELRFCNNILNIYKKCTEYASENRKELGLGENYKFKCPLYSAEKENKNDPTEKEFKGFRIYVKVPRKYNGEVQPKFYHKPEESGDDDEETLIPSRLTEDDIREMITDGSKGFTPYAYYGYPSFIIDSIYLGIGGPVMQLKLNEVFVYRKHRKSTDYGPSLITHFDKTNEMGGKGKHPPTPDLNTIRNAIKEYSN
jgi:hypothetical protein